MRKGERLLERNYEGIITGLGGKIGSGFHVLFMLVLYPYTAKYNSVPYFKSCQTYTDDAIKIYNYFKKRFFFFQYTGCFSICVQKE